MDASASSTRNSALDAHRARAAKRISDLPSHTHERHGVDTTPGTPIDRLGATFEEQDENSRPTPQTPTAPTAPASKYSAATATR
eukprot:m.251769 g.251769  ORF g.251769 m.251769 type:complete len:84 (-) comp97114_c0_seq1:256-507(-)